MAAVCAAVVLASPAHAAATTAAVRVPAAVAAPELCTPQQEDQGQTDDAVAKNCHYLRAVGVEARANYYAGLITGNENATQEEIRAAQATQEAATAARADAYAADTAALAADAAWAANTAVVKLTDAYSDYYSLEIRNTATAAKDAAAEASDDETNGRDAALNKKADETEAAARAAIGI